MQACANGAWGACSDTTPAPEDCASGLDMDCDGTATACTGSPVWGEVFGGKSADASTAVAVDSKGDVVVTGNFAYTVNFADPASAPVTRTGNADGSLDAFVAKYTSAGKLVWVQTYGGPHNDQGTGVAVDADDDVVVVGSFNSSIDFGMGPVTGSNIDAFVAKLSGADGSTVWARTFGSASAPAGIDQQASAVALDAQGDVAVVGNFGGSIAFDASHTLSSSGVDDHDGFVVVLDAMGNYKWSQDVHGDPVSDPAGFDWLRGVAFDGAGNVVITGVGTGGTMSFGPGVTVTPTTPGATGNHVLVGAYDPTGTPRWGLALADASPQMTPLLTGRGIAAGANGEVVVTGVLVGSMVLPSGSTLTAAGAYDVFLVKLDAVGHDVWGERFGGQSGDTDTGATVALDQFGNVVLGGHFTRTITLGQGGPALSVQGSLDAFAAKLDPTGKVLWARGMGANQAAYAYGIAVDREPVYVQGASPPGAVIMVGAFGVKTGDTIDLGLPSGPLASNGGLDMFLVHLAP
jgi:hypothetical protein